jgi:hypothetical protein
MEELVDVTAVEVIGDYRLRLTFQDGTVGDVDLSRREWHGVFEPLRDPSYFARVDVDAKAGTIAWPDGLDMAPEPLYAEARRHPAQRAPRPEAKGRRAPPVRTMPRTPSPKETAATLGETIMGGTGLEPVTPSLSIRPRRSRAFALVSPHSRFCWSFAGLTLGGFALTCTLLRGLLVARGSTASP